MEKLRIKNNDLYKIEVNDDGEYIEFDLSDIGLPYKCYEALEKITNMEKEVLEEEKKLKELAKNDTDPFSENNKKVASFELETYKKMREIMDGFLGENACQKIFGNRNYPLMFDDLIKELSRKRPELGNKSHFDKMGFKSNEINNRIMNKYKKNKERVI